MAWVWRNFMSCAAVLLSYFGRYPLWKHFTKGSGSLVPNGNIQKVVPWRATWVRGLTRPAAASPMHTVHTDTHRVATARVGLTGTISITKC